MKRRSFFQGLCGLFVLPFFKTQPKKLEANPYIHNLPKLGDKPARRLYETLMCTEELEQDIIWDEEDIIRWASLEKFNVMSVTPVGFIDSISYTTNNQNSYMNVSCSITWHAAENYHTACDVDTKGEYVYLGQKAFAVYNQDGLKTVRTLGTC